MWAVLPLLMALLLGASVPAQAQQFTEAQTLPELEAVIDERFRYYNHRRRHSQIGNQPPVPYLADLLGPPEITYQ
jgi:hypothetical protein